MSQKQTCFNKMIQLKCQRRHFEGYHLFFSNDYSIYFIVQTDSLNGELYKEQTEDAHPYKCIRGPDILVCIFSCRQNITVETDIRNWQKTLFLEGFLFLFS